MVTSGIDRIAGVRTAKAIKAAVRAATTANIVLSGEQTVDGIALVAGDRVLIKDQTDAKENGVYNVSTGSWARARDFNSDNEISEGTLVVVNSGTVSENIQYSLETSAPSIGVSSLTFGIQAISGTAFGRSLLDASDATTARALLDATSLAEIASAEEPVSLADGATITFDMDAAINAEVTLAGNRTLDFASINLGQRGVLRVTQDGTGSRTMAYSAECEFPDGVTPVLTTAAGADDFLEYFAFTASRVLVRLISDVK